MRRLAVRLAVAFLTFYLGVLVFDNLRVWKMHHDAPIARERTRSEDKILEIVLRFEMTHFTPDLSDSVYYLSYFRVDPSAAVMNELQVKKLPVRRLSELDRGGLTQHSNHLVLGDTEFILSVARIQWINKDEVLAVGSLRRGSNKLDRAFMFHLVREGASWVIKGYEWL